jgi:FMN hydrolase / 5-amino-6-(5-phospho-D-ribitylamino)uracil phosphatase
MPYLQAAIDFSRVKGISLDLDETLWPIMPTIVRAEALTQAWISDHAPKVVATFDTKAMRGLREELQAQNPQRKIDLLMARRDTLLHAFAICGEPAEKALQALQIFVDARQQVTLFDDAQPFLKAFSTHLPIVALSNGFADVNIVGIGHFFKASVSAHIVGIAKPDKRIFEIAAQSLGCHCHEVLHIGDDLELDVLGALAADMQAFHVDRPKQDLAQLTSSFQAIAASYLPAQQK